MFFSIYTFPYLLLLFGFWTFMCAFWKRETRDDTYDGKYHRVSRRQKVFHREISRNEIISATPSFSFCFLRNGKRDVLGNVDKSFRVYGDARLLVTAGRRCREFHRRPLTWSYRIYDVARRCEVYVIPFPSLPVLPVLSCRFHIDTRRRRNIFSGAFFFHDPANFLLFLLL